MLAFMNNHFHHTHTPTTAHTTHEGHKHWHVLCQTPRVPDFCVSSPKCAHKTNADSQKHAAQNRPTRQPAAFSFANNGAFF